MICRKCKKEFDLPGYMRVLFPVGTKFYGSPEYFIPVCPYCFEVAFLVDKDGE